MHVGTAGVRAISQLARAAIWLRTEPKLGATRRKEKISMNLRKSSSKRE